MPPQVYSSKSTPILFADSNSAAAWQRANTDDDTIVGVSRDEYGYFIVRVLDEDDDVGDHDIWAAFDLAEAFDPWSELDETPTSPSCDSLARIVNAYTSSFDKQ